MDVNSQLNAINEGICKNIETYKGGDIGLLSQNILNYLRTLIEVIAVKLSGEKEYSYTLYQEKGKHFISDNHKYKFLYIFHENLQISESHYIQNLDNSERLMSKYYKYLIKIKKMMKEEFDMDILENIKDFPIKQDQSMKEYYKKIVEKIKEKKFKNPNYKFIKSYYVWKVKPFFINEDVYYEVTFSIARDFVSKFDKVVAFSKIEIPTNYALNFIIVSDVINVYGKNMPILIIENYRVSIRPCEFKNYAKIFGLNIKFTKNQEYEIFMNTLTKYQLNLLDIVTLNDDKYNSIKKNVIIRTKTTNIMDILDKSREIILKNKPGTNILKYFLYKLHNSTIKLQLQNQRNQFLSFLMLKYECIPFDKMPYCSGLVKHNPLFNDILNCINPIGRDCEFLAKYVQNTMKDNGELYIDVKELGNNIETIKKDINKFNSKVYSRHENRKLNIYKNFIYRVGDEKEIYNIIEKIKNLGNEGIPDYSHAMEFWLDKNPKIVDDDNKKEILKLMFSKSQVALIYGSAGTGKTMLIEYISKFFESQSKLFLANTNPAVNNLKDRINSKNSEFSTIYQCLKNGASWKCDILIVDECSTVSNSDIFKILENIDFTLLILVGDIYQIESIDFGNWFNIIKDFIPKTSVFELKTPYRTKNKNLIDLRDSVRNIDINKKGMDNVLEKILQYSSKIDNSVFTPFDKDEIILCLNYDGLYGINNINKFLQGNNTSKAIQWGTHIYKVGDPILFNESNRFAPLLYNNLKGKIIDIELKENEIFFSIEVDKEIRENEVILKPIRLLEESKNGKSKIRFSVKELEDTDNDDDNDDSIVPFQVAYAISIHKAQGLEYNSVKIIISDEVDEIITHNILYTAITRAREKLKIYWSKDTTEKILDKMKQRNSRKDSNLLKQKFNI